MISWLRLRLFRLRWWKVYRRARQLDQAVYVVAPFGPLPKGLKKGRPYLVSELKDMFGKDGGIICE